MKHVRTITFGFVFLLGAIALGQQANIKLSPQAPAKDAKAVGLKHNEVARTFTFNLSQHNADVRVVLLQMSENEERAIVMSPAVQGSLSIEFRGATFDEALGIIAKVMDFQLVNVGSRVLVYTRAEWDLKQQKMGVRTYRFHNIRAKEASELLGGLVSEKGNIKLPAPRPVGLDGGSSATTDHTAQDVLVVFDLESSLIRMDAVVAEIDRLPLQVLIEATILSVVLDDSNALGVDLSILGGHTNHNRMDMVSTLDGLPSFQEDATGITNFKRLAAGGTTSFSKMVPAADGGLSMGIISNNVAAFIRALETTTDTTVLANPKLLVVSHCLGEVNVGEEQGYLKGSTSTASATTETTEMLETGTILKVRPFIGKDGKIRMEIHPEISSGNVVEKANTALPEKKVSQVDTSVIVNDGKTIVIGGLFQEETTLKRNRVPLLGTLPTVGALFRGHKDEVKRSELIVLITPHIVGYQEAEAASEQVMEYINRARLGARRGLKWWGRNRRSDMFLTLARKSVASGDRTKARWMLSMALANTPMREEAIKMGQSLNGWDYSSEEPTLHFVETMLKQKAPPALKTKMFPANAKPKAKAKAKAKIKKASKKAAVKIVPVKTKPAKKAPAKKAPAEIMATPVAVMMPARPEPQALALPTPKN